MREPNKITGANASRSTPVANTDALGRPHRAIQEAGYFYQGVLNDEPAAQPYFREAEKLKHPDAPGSARDILRREFGMLP